VALRVRNTGDIVEEYHIDAVGDPALWCVIEPSSVRLYPGTTTTVQLTFSPPRNPDSAAGPHPFGVRVTPVETPDAVMVPEGNLTVTPFVDVRAELLPPTVRGWRRAKPKLVVDNYGNTTATAAVLANGSGNRLDFDIRTPSLQIPPGRAHFSVLRVRPERILWLGQKVTHPFSTTLQLSGTEPVSASGTYLQSALLPRWMARLLALLLALLGVFAGLWFAINPSVASDIQAGPTTSAAPTVSISASASASASPSASPSLTPSASQSPTQAAATQAAGAGSTTTVTASAPLTPTDWWKLNDSDTGAASSAVDTEAKQNLTLHNATWCPEFGCVEFDGSTYGETGSAAVPTASGNSFSIAAVVVLSKGATSNETMVSQDPGSSGVNSGFYLQYVGGSSGYWAFSMPGTQCIATAAGPAATGLFVYLVGEYDASINSLKIYVGGTLEKTCALNDPAQGTTGPLVLGRGYTNGSDADWFDGDLGNIQVYNNVALDQSQISALGYYFLHQNQSTG